MTLYALWRGLCGLSRDEAARIHNTRPDTVKSWDLGRRNAPPGAIAELRRLRARIERAAAEGLHVWQQTGRIFAIDLGVASDDHEAESLGWPCVGAQAASLALLVAGLPPEVHVRIVPRGSTPATAAAADQHERHSTAQTAPR